MVNEKQILIIRFLFFVLRSSSYGQLIACRDSIEDGYDFWLYLPEKYDDPGVYKPVVIFLHGKSLCGSNLSKVQKYGCIDALNTGVDIDAFVVAPQTNEEWEPSKVNEYYVIQSGDTLNKIAVENGTTVSILCKLNSMNKTEKLRIGRKIRGRLSPDLNNTKVRQNWRAFVLVARC